jgi:riboflavin kinase/FMN adenylyltransferase
VKVEKLPATPATPLVPRGENTLLTIGNFDGCHLGHQQLLETTRTLAKRAGAIPCAMTFSPPPSLYFGKRVGAQLFTQSQQIRAFTELGIEVLFLQEFTTTFASLPYQLFYERIRDQLGLKGIVVGEDFCFGKKRSGNVEKLRMLTQQNGLLFSSNSCYLSGDQKISSSHIREELEKTGDLQKVQTLLGRPYLIEGTLESIINERGARLRPHAQLLPKPGQYRGHAWWGDLSQHPPVMQPDPNLPPSFIFISHEGFIEVQLESGRLPTPLPTQWGIYLSSSM